MAFRLVEGCIDVYCGTLFVISLMLFFILIINWHAEGAMSRSFELALLVNHKIAFNLTNIENRNSLLKAEKCQIYTKYEQGWRRLYDGEKFRRNFLRFTTVTWFC